MKLLLISPGDGDERELPALPRFFAAGLRHYHVRKPSWSRPRLAEWLRGVPTELHPCLVLHTHHELAGEFNLGGLHQRDLGIPVSANRPSPHRGSSGEHSGKNACVSRFLTSRACHSLTSLRAALGQVDRVLVSPIFPSLSKPGHGPDPRLPRAAIALTLTQRTPAERCTEVIALGGVDATRLDACRTLGFDGAAVLGAVWLQPDPVAAFSALIAHAN